MARRDEYKRTHGAALQAFLIAGALLGVGCGDDDDKPDDGKTQEDGGDGHSDSGMSGDGDMMMHGDGDMTAGDGDSGQGDGDGGVVTGCASGTVTCEGATPVCADNTCVACSADNAGACGADQVCDSTSHTCMECTASDSSKCGASEVCDTTSHTCVERYGQFQLDCGNLPAKTETGCQGGPREVILATHESGRIAMLDPTDGHFLGWFKKTPVTEDTPESFLATQGPDQCIWTAFEPWGGDNAIDRLDTDSTFIDHHINGSSKLDDDHNAMVVDAHSIAFTHDTVYVASTSGNPNPRITRWTLDGTYIDTVLDDGREAEFLLVTNDGSLIISEYWSDQVQLIPPGSGTKQVIYDDVYAKQLAFAGNGKILVTDGSSGEKQALVDIASGQVTKALPYLTPAQEAESGLSASSSSIKGLYPLKNGLWLASSSGLDGIVTIDPLSTPVDGLVGLHKIPYDPAIASFQDFNYFGRACLSNEFVDSRNPANDPGVPENQCGAPAGDVLFAADFDDNSYPANTFDGFTQDANSDKQTLTIETNIKGANESKGSLKVSGSSNPDDPDVDVMGGARIALNNLKPTYIEYSVRVPDNAVSAGEFALNRGYINEFWVYHGYLADYQTNARPDLTAGWNLVQLRDINWTNFTYDLYLNCKRVVNDAAFYQNDPNVQELHLFNPDDTDAWFDNIVFK
ncbi:MAG: hypothetical protein QM778_21450 [Myxococcales bacterium]